MVAIEQQQQQALWLFKEWLWLLVLKSFGQQLVRLALLVFAFSVLLELPVLLVLLVLPQLDEQLQLKEQRALIITITQFLLLLAWYRKEKQACKWGDRIHHIPKFGPCKAWLFQVSLRRAS